MSKKPILSITDKAKVYFLDMLKQNPEATGVRIYLKKAGCTGLKYMLDYVVEQPAYHEILSIASELTIYVDRQAVPYILGSEIDYVKQGLNGRIIFNNPNEKDSCGCGESFNV